MSVFLISLLKLAEGFGLDILARLANIFSGIKLDAKFNKNEFITGVKKYIYEMITILLFTIVASQLPLWLAWCNLNVVDIIKNNFGTNITAENISNTTIIIIYAISIIRYLIKTIQNIIVNKNIDVKNVKTIIGDIDSNDISTEPVDDTNNTSNIDSANLTEPIETSDTTKVEDENPNDYKSAEQIQH